MHKAIAINLYHNSLIKKLFDSLISMITSILLVPFILPLVLFIKITTPGPLFFIQKRVGKNGKIFDLIKFRTMRLGAEKEQQSLRPLNQADEPVFKILDDPRYTKIGKYLAHTGLDELPQLINVLKGEMSLVGPRPLPVYEAKRLTKLQKVREKVLPGITSNWVVSGSHRLSFNKWMSLDKEYVKNASFLLDLEILIKTAYIMLRQVVKQLCSLLHLDDFS